MTEPTTIDITPSWRAIVDVLIEVAAHGETKQARQLAHEELRRMALIADKAVEAAKAAKEG